VADTCPSCGKWTDEGLAKFRKNSKPIFGADLSKPLSEVVEDVRNMLTAARGQLSDISFRHRGWGEHLAPMEGLLTCGLISLHFVMEQMREHEAKQDSL
jgi:hypothetical protein